MNIKKILCFLGIHKPIKRDIPLGDCINGGWVEMVECERCHTRYKRRS